ncbi:hypothetical protein N040_21205 [Serratia marcescens EGD-HP20]|nr:hypothetical protein N040_21205 [Serratia marcescens EGD-HP20]
MQTLQKNRIGVGKQGRDNVGIADQQEMKL